MSAAGSSRGLNSTLSVRVDSRASRRSRVDIPKTTVVPSGAKRALATRAQEIGAGEVTTPCVTVLAAAHDNHGTV